MQKHLPAILDRMAGREGSDPYFMEKLISRKEAAKLLGISIQTLDAARHSGLISYVQYVENGSVYFTDAAMQEYISKCTHHAKLTERSGTYRKQRTQK